MLVLLELVYLCIINIRNQIFYLVLKIFKTIGSVLYTVIMFILKKSGYIVSFIIISRLIDGQTPFILKIIANSKIIPMCFRKFARNCLTTHFSTSKISYFGIFKRQIPSSAADLLTRLILSSALSHFQFGGTVGGVVKKVLYFTILGRRENNEGAPQNEELGQGGLEDLDSELFQRWQRLKQR